MIAWPTAPYVTWARSRPAPRFDLASSDLLPATAFDWPAMIAPLDPADDAAASDAALADLVAGHARVSAEQVVMTAGSSSAIFLALAALIRPGDAVVVEDPGYPPLASAARQFGAEVVPLPRPAASAFGVTAESFAAALTPRTRLALLTRPHNPTGSLLDTATLQAIAEVAERERVHVLVDEVYLDTLGDASLTPAACLSGRFISTASLTKGFGLVDLRCGWAVASAPVAARMRAAQAIIAPAPLPSRGLARRALEDLSLLADRARRIIVSNRLRVERALAGRDDVAWVRPAGGTVAFPRLLRVPDVDAFVDRLLVERHTAVVPGRFFGHPRHVRVAFGMSDEELAAGLEALTAALDAACLETVPR